MRTADEYAAWLTAARDADGRASTVAAIKGAITDAIVVLGQFNAHLVLRRLCSSAYFQACG